MAGTTLTSITACVSAILATGRPVSDSVAANRAFSDAWKNIARCVAPRDLDAQVSLAPSLLQTRTYVLDCVVEDAPLDSTDDRGRVIHTAVSADGVVGLLFGGEALAVVFESTPEAFALVAVGEARAVYLVRVAEEDACVEMPREHAIEYVKANIGPGAPCNVFLRP